MGDRLVSVIRHNGEIVAASYQHWAASDYEQMEDIMAKNIDSYNDNHEDIKDPCAAAVKILYDSIVEYNRSAKMIGLLIDKENATEEELKFVSLHPEIPSDPDNIGRSYGMISINLEKIDSWRDWADYEAEFEI